MNKKGTPTKPTTTKATNAKKTVKAAKAKPIAKLTKVAAKNAGKVMGYHVDRNGILHIWNVPVLNAGVFPYMGHSIDPYNQMGVKQQEVYAVLRKKSSFANPETMYTFLGVPVVDRLGHKLFSAPRSSIVKPYEDVQKATVVNDADLEKRVREKVRKYKMDLKAISTADTFLGDDRSEKNKSCVKDASNNLNNVIGCAFNPHFMKGDRSVLYVDMVIFDTVRYLFQIDMGVREVAACYSCSYALDKKAKDHEFVQSGILGNSIAMVACSRNFHAKFPKLTEEERKLCHYFVPPCDLTKVKVQDAPVKVENEPKKADPEPKKAKKPVKKAKKSAKKEVK